ncbi:MAG: RNA polymerase sigma factor [Gammaproteobacteria bacterium]|nr:RNA polymerase sigma factor [Gammaproteobacteria bacterium]
MDLYRDVSPELHRLLVRKLGNSGEAEEIAHDAFEKLLRLDGREDIADLRRFFFTMANRMALDVLRRRQMQDRHTREHLAVEVGERTIEDDPERVLIRRERLTTVQRALAGLPSKTRYVFLLHRFEGYTYGEIAKTVQLSQKSVEYHMNRALQAISLALRINKG